MKTSTWPRRPVEGEVYPILAFTGCLCTCPLIVTEDCQKCVDARSKPEYQ